MSHAGAATPEEHYLASRDLLADASSSTSSADRSELVLAAMVHAAQGILLALLSQTPPPADPPAA